MGGTFGGSGFARRTDRNQSEIVEALRADGFTVVITSAAGGGYPDLHVSFWAHGIGPLAVLVEVKDGEKPPAQRKLTPAQRAFFRTWLGPACVVESSYEACWLLGQLRRGHLAALEAQPFLSRLPEGRRGAFGAPTGIQMPRPGELPLHGG